MAVNKPTGDPQGRGEEAHPAQWRGAADEMSAPIAAR